MNQYCWNKIQWAKGEEKWKNNNNNKNLFDNWVHDLTELGFAKFFKPNQMIDDSWVEIN